MQSMPLKTNNVMGDTLFANPLQRMRVTKVIIKVLAAHPGVGFYVQSRRNRLEGFQVSPKKQHILVLLLPSLHNTK